MTQNPNTEHQHRPRCQAAHSSRRDLEKQIRGGLVVALWPAVSPIIFESSKCHNLLNIGLSFDSVHYRSLCVPSHNVLLDPTDRPQCDGSQHAKSRSNHLPRQHEQTQYTKLAAEFDPFIDLIEVILALNIVAIAFVRVVRCRVGNGDELEDSRKMDACAIERDDPDAEELVEGDIEA